MAARTSRAYVFATAITASAVSAESICLVAVANTFSTEVILNDTIAISGVVDTAATDLVIICDNAASSLGFALDPTIELQTAAGTTRASEVTIAKVRIGPIEVRNVAALVLRQQGPCRVLMGTSFLSKLNAVVLKGLTLTLVGKRAVRGAATARRSQVPVRDGLPVTAGVAHCPSSSERRRSIAKQQRGAIHAPP